MDIRKALHICENACFFNEKENTDARIYLCQAYKDLARNGQDGAESRYVLLGDNEIMQLSDEYYSEISLTWEQIDHKSAGAPYKEDECRPVRRLIEMDSAMHEALPNILRKVRATSLGKA